MTDLGAGQVGDGDRHVDVTPCDELAAVTARLSAVDELQPGLLAGLPQLARHQARMVPVGPAADPRGSYIGGHPYLPLGQDWPADEDGRPWLFLAQVNFADVAAAGGVDGFPSSGLLQWFAGDGELYGQTYDGKRDPARVRFYAAEQLAGAAAASPDAPWPGHDRADLAHPVSCPPTAVQFVRETSMPSEGDLFDGYEPQRFGPLADPELIEAVEDQLGVDFYELYDGQEASDEDAGDTVEAADPDRVVGGYDKVGGWPYMIQTDPRRDAASTATNGPGAADTLLIQLDSDNSDLTMWGDAGVGWLFGDPVVLAAGDTSSLWCSWTCH